MGWLDDDAARVQSASALVTPWFAGLVDDFYAEIENHPEARRVITGGEAQIARLKKTLLQWLGELFSGRYDRDYVERRWRVGCRHVEIGLNQVYTNAALSRLRRGLLAALEKQWPHGFAELLRVRQSLNTLLDLDLAIIEDAYQQVYVEQQAEQRYRWLFENMLDGLLMLGDGGGILAANPAACAMLGASAAELQAAGLGSLRLHTTGATRPATWSDFFSSRTNIGECSLERAGGASVDVEYRAVAGFAPGLNLISLHDVTARKQAEDRARQAERLAAIGETMAALVHESRNALQRSKASLEMLLLEIEDRPEAVRLVGRVQKAQEDLHRLYEEVRQWAAPLQVRREECNLRELWQEVWCLVKQAHAARETRLVEEVTCPDPVGQFDPFLIAQVFRNIFENALEVTPAGAPVTVRCSESTSGAEILIAIRDEGPGLTPPQQRQIFEPFFTTKAKGTGLGMAIAQRIVESHRGAISASSPRGAQIEIRLPRRL